MKKINTIEGLRTIGWLGVLLCHFKGAFFPDAVWWTDGTPIRFIYSGNAYVRLLFVISGFVISLKYFEGKQYEAVLPDIVKRYFRLMPPVFFAELLVYVFMCAGLLRNAEAAAILHSEGFLGAFNQFKPDFLQFLRESLFATYVRQSNAYIGPLWTMSYEFLGAILVLAAHGIFKRSGFRWVFYGVCLIAFDGYFNYFVLGMMICDLYTEPRIQAFLSSKRIARIVLIIAGYCMLSMVNLNDAEKSSRVVFAAGIVLFMMGILYSDIAEKVLGNRVMTAGGKLAYSAYILHWPIIEVFSCGLFLIGYGQVEQNLLCWGILLLTIGVVILASKFFVRYIESIGEAFARSISNRLIQN